MKLDFSTVNADDFYLSDRGQFILIHSKKSKHDWQPDELPLRSLLCRHDGEIVCSGWPKFFNYGEHPAHTQQLEGALSEKQPVLYTEKVDGSLVIRSVIDGKVHFRTRGNHTLEEFEDEVLRVVRSRYPALLQPALLPGVSLLMEYVSKERRIILRYEEADLTLLGGMRLHDNHLPETLAETNLLRQMARPFGLPVVASHRLPVELGPLLEEIKGWQSAEGIVARFQHGDPWMLVKIKSARYLQLHAMRYAMTDGKIRRFVWMKGLSELYACKEALREIGFDYEIVDLILPSAEESLARLEAIRGTVVRVREGMEKEGAFSTDRSRKEQVEAIRAVVGQEKELFTLGIALLDRKEEEWMGAAFLSVPMAAYKKQMSEQVDWLKTEEVPD